MIRTRTKKQLYCVISHVHAPVSCEGKVALFLVCYFSVRLALSFCVAVAVNCNEPTRSTKKNHNEDTKEEGTTHEKGEQKRNHKRRNTTEETPTKIKEEPKEGTKRNHKKKNKKRNHNSTQDFPSLLLFLSVLIVAFVCLFCRWSCVCQLTSKAGSSSAEEHNRDKNYAAVLT